jgi:hypothetical protein
MPDRIIRERACHSPTLDMLTDGAERLFWRLTSKADDQGRFDADPRSLLASCFPLRIGRLPSGTIRRWRDELALVGLVVIYQLSDRIYGAFVTWDRWQRKRESQPKRPAPDAAGVEILVSEAQLPRVAANCGELPPTRARASGERRESLTTERREASTTCPSPQAAAKDAAPPSADPDAWATAKWPSAEALAYLYNQAAPDNLPAVETLSPKRCERARRLLRTFPEKTWWLEVFAEYKRSKFLKGQTPPKPGHEGFRPDFDWLLSNGRNGAENCVKVHDGAYQ